MSGFSDGTQATYSTNEAGLVGKSSRLGGTGQQYHVVGMSDANTAFIEIKTWDEPLPYPVSAIALDLAGVCSSERFLPLVGQYRTMGPDGPTYQVVSIADERTAKIWIVAEDDDEDYRIEDILIDPMAID